MAKKQILAILLIIIVGLIIYNYSFNNQRENVFKYNGYYVYQTAPTVYNIEIFLKNDKNPHYISIRYDPRELDNIKVEKDIKERLLREEVYVTLGPELTSESIVAVAEIAKIISNQFLFNIPVHTALTYKKENIPVKTCSDVSIETSVILLKLSDKTEVFKQNECIIIEGQTEEEIVRASTKLILDLLGIAKR